MGEYAKYEEYQLVRLKADRPGISEHPFTLLDQPQTVTRNDCGVIVLIHDVELPGYQVKFFDSENNTLDLLTLTEDEIEPWE